MREVRRFALFLLLLLGILLTGCADVPVVAVTPEGTSPVRSATFPPATAAATATLIPSATSTPTVVPTSSPTTEPTVTPTPDPYKSYTIDALADRTYGGGSIEILEVLAENSWFTRYLYRYDSDGLAIYGFLNVPASGGPAGDGPYPVVIALHGYIDPAIYDTIDYTTRYADALARAGYIVFHPNLRGYPPSDDGDNLFRVGMAVDVLNLIALIREDDGSTDVLAGMLPDRIGLWGHSMGGGISTRVITISSDVQAAVLYAPMSGDERQNFEAIQRWSGETRGLAELDVPEDQLLRISPMYYYDRIRAAVRIHHGRADELVPLAWSVRTCEQLTAQGVDVGCVYYNGMPHTFYGDGDLEFIQSTAAFFDAVLKAP